MERIDRHIGVPGLLDSSEWSYGQVVVANGFVFVSGQGGFDAAGVVVSLEFEPQVRKTYENIEVALRSVGATLQDLVATTTFITDWRFGRVLTELRKELLGDDLPTSALIGVQQLAYPEMLIEVQATALAPS